VKISSEGLKKGCQNFLGKIGGMLHRLKGMNPLGLWTLQVGIVEWLYAKSSQWINGWWI